MPWRRIVHDGTELTNSETTMVTFSSTLTEGGAMVVAISISNRSSSRRRVTIHLQPSGGSPTETNTIFEDYVPPNRSITVPGGPWWANSSAVLSGLGDVANTDVGVRASCVEEYIAG